jgi:hypothetical protein
LRASPAPAFEAVDERLEPCDKPGLAAMLIEFEDEIRPAAQRILDLLKGKGIGATAEVRDDNGMYPGDLCNSNGGTVDVG